MLWRAAVDGSPWQRQVGFGRPRDAGAVLDDWASSHVWLESSR